MKELHLKLHYFIDRLGDLETGREIRVKPVRVSEWLITNNDELISANGWDRIGKLFKQVVFDDALIQTREKLKSRPVPVSVKNYDNEDLEDFKGGIRKGGAGGNRNNAGAIIVSETYL